MVWHDSLLQMSFTFACPVVPNQNALSTVNQLALVAKLSWSLKRSAALLPYCQFKILKTDREASRTDMMQGTANLMTNQY